MDKDKIKIFTVDGKIVEPLKSNEIYLAMYRSLENFWVVSGCIYRTPEEITANLSAFNPKRILIIKVKMELGDDNND